MIKVFIGFDPVETVAYHVLNHSILRHASQPVATAPIALHQLRGVFSRERDPKQSTEFSFSRFLVPYLCDYDGWAIFMDCDMLVRRDIAELWALRDEKYAIQVVKHNHVPREESKFLNQPQTKYHRKNWSSVMLMNCAKCKALTPEFVNSASGLELHQFKWIPDDGLIGEIPPEWNHLVGYDAPRDAPANIHYTIGGPYFDAYQDSEYSQEWFAEKSLMLAVKN